MHLQSELFLTCYCFFTIVFWGAEFLRQIFLFMSLQDFTVLSFLWNLIFINFFRYSFKIYFSMHSKTPCMILSIIVKVLEMLWPKICILQLSYVFLIIIFDLAWVLWDFTIVTCTCFYTLTPHSHSFIGVKSCIIVIKSCCYLTWPKIYPNFSIQKESVIQF